jgi:hypothetical protein
MVKKKTWVVGLVNGYCSRKTICKPSKKPQLVTGLEFDPTDVGALKSAKTSTFDVANAVHQCPSRSYQTNVDLKRNQIFILKFIWKKRYKWVSQNQ